MKHKLIGIAVIATALATPALAAEMPLKAPPAPVAPTCIWCGWYIGANAGWVGSADDRITNTGTDTDGGGLGTALAIGAIPTSLNLDYDGFLGGGQIGYNWQVGGNWLIGVEADFDGSSAKGSTTVGPITIPGFVPVASAFDRELDWLSTIRGRLGVTSGSFLFYGTGGLAIGETKISNQFICPTCAPPSASEATTNNQVSNTSVGWTAGAGIEWMFATNWSIKAEYLYADLGNHSSTISYAYGPFNSTLTSSARDAFNIARAGIDWHFNLGGGPIATQY